MDTKLCFVIMGFGKKTDYSNGITLDLDKTYKNIIKPAAEGSGYKCFIDTCRLVHLFHPILSL